MNHVTLCFSDSSGQYYKHALVTAASVFANTASQVRLHLVHDETLSAEKRQLFSDLAARFGKQALFYSVPPLPQAVSDKMNTWPGRGALYRLLLPELIQVNVVLYFDCDIVCECDVEDIFRYDVSNFFLGAVKFGRERIPYLVKRLQMDEDRYANSGTLLMNLRKIREELPEFKERLFSIILEHKGKITDQEALNILFNQRADGWYFLPEIYNFRIWSKDHAALPLEEYQGKVLHFSGKKPWENFSHAALRYWRYHSQLFPEEDVFSAIMRLPSYQYAELCAFMLRTPLLRKIVRRAYEFHEQGFWKTLVKRITQGSGEFPRKN